MVTLVPMSEEAYQEYLQPAIRAYGEEKVKSGNYRAEDAQQGAEKEFQDLLPQGLATPDNYFYSIRLEESGANVGMIWIAVSERSGKRSAFVFDFSIAEAYRRHGYGEQAFKELEAKVSELGLNEIGLHVFGHNQGARALYKKLGYVETNVTMAKKLD